MTNRELLMMLDGDLGERAVKNCIKFREGEFYLGKKYSYGRKISQSLLYAFPWIDSLEGYIFWQKIYDDLIRIDL